MRKLIRAASTLAIIGSLTALGVVTGCSEYTANDTFHHPASAGADAALPFTVADKPVTINLPHRLVNPPLLRAVAKGAQVHVYSNARWHGHHMTIYFLPRQNIVQDADHYDVVSARNLQKIAECDVRPNGTWSTVWRSGSVKMPIHRTMFLLARSDDGEIGLAQINTRN